jgi:uncharacterized protein with GYD domain
MSFFLVRWNYEPGAWESLMDSPVDRRQNTAKGLEEIGAKLHGYWYEMGSYDGYMLVEAPDNRAPAGIRALDVGVGIVRRMEVIPLLEVEEMMEALKLVAPQRERVRPKPRATGAAQEAASQH